MGKGPLSEEWIALRESQLPPDVNLVPDDTRQLGNAMAAFDRAPLGEPPIDFTVRSVFDSRPIQGYDFNVTSSTIVSGSIPFTTLVSFIVPTGLVCVLRQLHHFFTVPPVIASRADVLLSLQVNGADVPNNTSIPVGVASDDIVKCFVIADENTQVTAKFVTNVDVLVEAVSIFVQFYGNFLLKTGRPSIMEIANQTGEGKTSTISTISAP